MWYELSSTSLNDKKALEKNPDGLEIIVDNNVAKGNVERFLKSLGYTASIKEEGDVFIISPRR